MSVRNAGPIVAMEIYAVLRPLDHCAHAVLDWGVWIGDPIERREGLPVALISHADVVAWTRAIPAAQDSRLVFTTRASLMVRCGRWQFR